jgi:predicted ferric reductase
LGGILAAQVAVWTLALLLAPAHFPSRQLVAEGFSTFAIVLMSTNLLLSTRAPWLERLLCGLDRVFVTHRTIGLSVGILVVTHFLLVPKSIGYVASKPVGYATIALLLVAIFVASAPRFPWDRLVPMRYQTWKLSHKFMGLLLLLAVTHSLLAHTFVRVTPILAVYVYGIAALGLTSWLYRELLFTHVGPFSDHLVAESRALPGGVVEIVLVPVAAALARTAGQFVFASFAAGPTTEQHPFTVSSGSGDGIRLSIKASGDFTKALLVGVPEGSLVRLEGPYGAFKTGRGGEQQLWLAGGIGVTPFLSMANDLDASTQVLLVWSVHTPEESIYAEELARIARDRPNLRVVIRSTAQQGHLDLASLELAAPVASYSAFVCGPLAMRVDYLRQLQACGVQRSQVFFEEFRLR